MEDRLKVAHRFHSLSEEVSERISDGVEFQTTSKHCCIASKYSSRPSVLSSHL